MLKSLEDFIEAGCIAGIERAAAERATDDKRRFWLPHLEAMAVELATQDAPLEQRAIVEGQVRRLRRVLGVSPSVTAEVVARRREQTRERVRRHRARLRASA